MRNLEKREADRNIRFILLFLFICLIGLGIWKCPNLSLNKESRLELALKKEDSLEVERVVRPKTVIAENALLKEKKELSVATSMNKLMPLKPKEKNISNVAANSKEKIAPEIKKEATISEPKTERTAIISNEASFQEAIVVYKVNKKIDKRLPASSDNVCKATTTFKITKSSIQTSIAISPDGANFAVGNHNNYVSVMNMEGIELLKLIGHKGYVQSLKYAPNGKSMVTGSMDNTAKLWGVNDGKQIKSLEGHTEGILSVAYSPNGKYIATGSLDHTTILWDVKAGKKLFQLAGHQSEIAEVAFSANSKFVITGSSDGTAKIWDVEKGEILYALEGHDGVVGGVAFTPNGKLIITASVDKIRLWNAKTGKHIHTINDNKSRIMSIFISNDGAYISSSKVNGLITIWKIIGGKKLCEYEGHSKRAREAVFHPTKKNTVISASNDHTISMWKFEPQ